MRLCIAQIAPVKGDILQNIERHKKLIAQAISAGADSIFFPELSLTAYEPELADALAMETHDIRLFEFQQISNRHHIMAGIGIPLRHPNGVSISMVIFRPHEEPTVYSKQYLHEDETPFFVSGQNNTGIIQAGLRIAPAICYEISVQQHITDAIEEEAEVYLASVAKSAEGVTQAHERLSQIAKQYSIPVLMSNCVGPCDNFVGAGGSAVWDASGRLINQLNDREEGILLVEIQE